MPDLDAIKHAKTDADVSATILERWSPRAFSDRAVGNDTLKSLFTAASWAASSRNEQPWRFVLGVKPSETHTKILNALTPPNQSWAGAAPVLFATFASNTFAANGAPNGVAAHDVGAASATLSLEATRLGLHTHGMAGFDPELLRASFGVPSNFSPVACWALGYLGDPASLSDNYRKLEEAPRQRKPLSEIVFSHWEQPATLD